ncbi:PTS sugar transporter subunit IIA [Holdemania massiliensis]|uniref:PTS sugar transporter subunit IIA n=1 Tax=Holdemania massiliensis TaxID=1468449 RepID=UPI001F05AD3F|nr:hypothetical protein [Holdemania massiliensis]MCH1939708.1 hypothetical protein [Holdemania massiliensis]
MKYLIAGHGDYAQGVVNTLKFFKDDLNNVDLLPYTSDFEEQLQMYLERQDPAEPLCMVTDLVGGSVNLEAMRQLRKRNFYLISGANISLLLEMLFSEVTEGAQIEEIVHAARDQMVYVNAMMGAQSE